MRATFVLLAALATVLSIAGCRRGNTGSDVETCTPGATLRVTCGGGAECGGRCSGDATLTICEGSASDGACLGGEGRIGFDDDSCDGLCPGVTVTCPASGSIRIVPSGYMGSTFSCEWVVRQL